MPEILSKQEVLNLVKLARLSLTEGDLEAFSRSFSDILSYVKALDAVNLDGVEPSFHPIELKNVFRKDEPVKSPNLDDLLKSAPKLTGNLIETPPIL